MKGEKDYTKAKIYKLINSIDEYFYIGHTCTSLAQRKKYHIDSRKTNPNRKLYKHFNNIGWVNVRIILIDDDLGVLNMEQLLRKEDEHIQQHINNEYCLNACRAFTGLTKKEYIKQWAEEHKTELKEYHKEYRNGEKREELLEKKRQYEKDNKERIAESRREKIQCPHCNKSITRSNLSAHKRRSHSI